MSGANNQHQGLPAGAAYADVTAGNQGETFVRNFLKLDTVKRDLRDKKDEKKYRRNTKCHYDSLAEHRFVGNTHTVQEMQPKMEPIQAVGIIMAHSRYKNEFIEAMIEDVSPYCLNESCIIKGLDDASIDAQSVEEKFPKVTEALFNDPTDKLRTIATFRNGMAHEQMLKDRSTMLPALQTILRSILTITKDHSFSRDGKNWKEVLKAKFDEAVTLGVTPGIGSNLEHLIATGLNLTSSHVNRSTVASMSHTQYKLGKQTVELSKAVLSDKMEKLEEVLVIRNLDILSSQDDYDANLATVESSFGFLKNVKEFFALSIEKKVVYVRFNTRKAKFVAENQFKSFRIQNPGRTFNVSRPTLETFSSDIRLSREALREKLLHLYTNALQRENLEQYTPTPEAFKRGIFLDEQHFWEKGKLRTWVEFTDPSNCLAVLTYSCDSDPFVGFQWENSIPNPRFRAKHPGDEYSIANRGIHVLNKYTKRTK